MQQAPSYAPMFEWIRKREAIRQAREAGHQPPWTDDPVLASWRFCNVRREDDAVTRWIADNIRKPFAAHPRLWLMLCIARMINHPACLAQIMAAGAWPDRETFEPGQIAEVIALRLANNDTCYNPAYVIPPSSEPGQPKHQYLAETVFGALWRDRIELDAHFSRNEPRSLRESHGVLTVYIGWGQFLAYQAIVDMRYTALLASAVDIETWAAAGPGTLRGLNRLHGRPVKQSLKQERALSEMREIYAAARSATGVEFDFSDVPNILCETDKFMRAHVDGRSLSQKYVPAAGQRQLVLV